MYYLSYSNIQHRVFTLIIIFLFLQGCKYGAPSKLESSETKIEEIDVSKIEGLPVPTDLVNCIGDRNTGPLKLGPIPNSD